MYLYDCEARSENCLLYSKINKRLFFGGKYSNIISVVNLDRKRVEIKIKLREKRPRSVIYELRLLGKNEQILICLTLRGMIRVYFINFDLKKVFVFKRYRLPLSEEKHEFGVSMAVCDKSDYILVEVRGSGDRGPSLCSKMFILRPQGNNLVQKGMIHCFDLGLTCKPVLQCCGYFGKKILWLGLQYQEEGLAQVYEYNTETEAIRELEGCRVHHGEELPSQMYRDENYFWFSGSKGRVVRLEVVNLLDDFLI